MNTTGFSSQPGGFTRIDYDKCAYDQELYESTGPLMWMMYSGKFENCDKCVYDDKSFYRPFDSVIVDTESELKNITRPQSKCNRLKYNPKCKKSTICTSTFDKSVPVVMAQECCPIVRNNIEKMTGPGYTLYSTPLCDRYPNGPNQYGRDRPSDLEYRMPLAPRTEMGKKKAENLRY